MTTKHKRPANHLLLDPSRTTMVRRAFVADMRRRLAMLKSAIWDLVVVQDAFGHRERKPMTFNAWTPEAREAALVSRRRRLARRGQIMLHRGMSQEEYAEFKRTGVVKASKYNNVSEDSETSRFYAKQHDDPGVLIRFYAPKTHVREDKLYKGDYRVTKDFKVRRHIVLDRHVGNISVPTLNTRFKFLTDDKKLEAFNRWFEQQVKQGLLEVDHQGKPWTSRYVDSAWRKGRMRAYFDAHKEDLSKPADWLAGSREQFLRSAFDAPETVSKLRLLGTRNFELLKGITADMSAKLNRVLASGIAAGRAPRDIAREIVKEVDGIGKKRASLIAQTEIIHSHAEGQLDAFEDLGVEELEITAEWGTAGDTRVCPRCNALGGMRFTVKSARGLIPLHPRCRCSWRPVTGKSPSKLSKAQMKALGEPSPTAPTQAPSKPPTVPKQPKTAKEVYAANQQKFADEYNLSLNGGDLPVARAKDVVMHIDKQLAHMKQRSKLVAEYMEEGEPVDLMLSDAKKLRDGSAGLWNKNKGIELAAASSYPATDVRPQVGGYNVSYDLGSVFRHEYGHSLWQFGLSKDDRNDFNKNFKDMLGEGKHEVSTYAATNIRELWAEAFAVLTSPQYLKGMLPKALEAWLVDKLLWKFR